MCREQTSVSYQSLKVVFLDADPCVDSITAIDLWYLVLEVLHSPNKLPVREDQWRDETQRKDTNSIRRNTPTESELKMLCIDCRRVLVPSAKFCMGRVLWTRPV